MHDSKLPYINFPHKIVNFSATFLNFYPLINTNRGYAKELRTQRRD